MRPKLTVIDGKKEPGAKTTGYGTFSREKNVELKLDTSSADSKKQTEYVETLYHKYHDSLLRYLRCLLPGDEDAIEILQETYIRLLKQESLDRLETNARAYLFTVATNLVRDCLRKRTSQYHNHHIPFDELKIPNGTSSPDRIAAWHESLNTLKKALLELTPLTRRIFIQHRFEQMTYPEIASSLKISTRTVERHMCTAIRHMQHWLRDLI